MGHYYGGYYGYPGYYGYGHRYYGYGGYYGYPYRYGYAHHYGKRSADAEPEAEAEADPAYLYAGHYGYAGYGYASRYYGYGGYYGAGYGYPYARYGAYRHFGKRSADAEAGAPAAHPGAATSFVARSPQGARGVYGFPYAYAPYYGYPLRYYG